jgi:hypothetical protein
VSEQHVCIECGVPMSTECEHAYSRSTAFCTSFGAHAGSDVYYQNRQCAGYATGATEPCPCSCHLVVSDEDVEAAIRGAQKIQHDLEGGEHATV